MSFLQEVLQTFETVNIETLNKELPALSVKSANLKKHLLQYIDNVQVKFTSRPKRISDLLQNSTKLTDTASDLKEKLGALIGKNVPDTKIKLTDYQLKLKEVDVNLSLCSNICRVHEGLMNIKALLDKRQYVEALLEVKITEDFMSALNGTEPTKTLRALQKAVLFETMLLTKRMDDLVQTHVEYTHKKDEGSIKCGITITKGDDASVILKALSAYKENVFLLDYAARFLWENVFSAIVHFSTIVEVEDADGFVALKLKSNENLKDSYGDIYKNLIIVADFLHMHFNYELENGTVVNYIGDNIRDNLSELIIKFCLDDTIPSTSEGLVEYQEVIKATETLQTKLITTGIFSPTTTLILEHANKVDVLFINKKCRAYIATALGLMKRDLHDVVLVGTPVDPTKFSVDFAQCSVSKSVLELLRLVERIVSEATTSPELCAGRLYETAQNIVSRYAQVVRGHHDKLLQTIPQQVAIFYNNCCYLSYELAQNRWHLLHQKLPESIRDNVMKISHENLKIVASRMLEDNVQEQIKQINAIIKDSTINDLQITEKLNPQAEKSVRQCLRQQELLKTVWQKILNYHEYNRIIGLILNSLCTSLIDSVLCLEDISNDGALQLAELLKLVTTRGPKLFTEPKEIHMYVESWHKLSETVFVLNTSLVNINDRWADGKGPLALHFQPEELRRMIKALFQNTEVRATLLAQIRDNKL